MNDKPEQEITFQCEECGEPMMAVFYDDDAKDQVWCSSCNRAHVVIRPIAIED